jgi:hypothetical protein
MDESESAKFHLEFRQPVAGSVVLIFDARRRSARRLFDGFSFGESSFLVGIVFSDYQIVKTNRDVCTGTMYFVRMM